MPDLDSYQQLLTVHANDAKAQVRLKSDGTLTTRSTGDIVGGFLTGGAKGQNDTTLADFKAALTTAYGANATDAAFTQSGLDGKAAQHEPLTLHRMKDAMTAACNEQALSQDQAYKAQYQQREAQATAWTPNTVASSLQEANHPGLRCHTVETDDMCVHSWHPCNHEASNLTELDTAVRAEMAALPTLETQPRLQNLQARLNLLEKMVTQAETQNAPGKANVFTAPEWLFSSMEGQDAQGNPLSGGALTETEMQKVTTALTDMSARHPDTVIMPGTVLWSKPVANPIAINGQQVPADMVFNVAPVLSDGALVHTTYKKNDGGDSAFASKGINPRSAADMPSASNGASARFQVFAKDVDSNFTNYQAELAPIQTAIKVQMLPTAPGRAWETPLRPPGPPGNSNHMFQAQGKNFAVDICADHGEKEARKEYLGNGPSTQPGSIGATIKADGGTDAHIVIAAGRSINAASSFIKTGGLLAGNDMNSGVFKVQKVTAQGLNGIGEAIPKLGPAAVRDRTMDSAHQPDKVKAALPAPDAHSHGSSLRLSGSK